MNSSLLRRQRSPAAKARINLAEVTARLEAAPFQNVKVNTILSF
jgi:hypothetical protein